MSEEQKTKKTEDIYFAAGLLSYNAELAEIDKSRPRHQKFVFANNEILVYILDSDGVPIQETADLDRVEVLFASGRLLFPSSYPESVRKVKAIIYS